MNQYLALFNQYMQEHRQCGGNNMESVLEFLWECYSMENPVNDLRIHSCEEALRPFMEALPLDASDTLFEAITDLCIAYQRVAFLEGLTIGARLHAELSAP